VIKATHEHKNKGFQGFEYMVTNNRVFMKIENEWRLSTVALRDLAPIGTKIEEYISHNNHPLIAKDKKTNREILFNSIGEAAGKGFNRQAIRECLQSVRYSHKGYEWRVAV
jgi:hypothetical protein